MIDEFKKRFKGKIVIICIGNELRGDDGAGPALAKNLEGKITADVINCEEVPESYTDKIKKLKPDTVVIVDTIDIKAKPGSVTIIDKESLSELKLYTTHNIPLKVFVDYLYSETKADIFLIGIQPKTFNLKIGLSKEVEETIEYLKDILMKLRI